MLSVLHLSYDKNAPSRRIEFGSPATENARVVRYVVDDGRYPRLNLAEGTYSIGGLMGINLKAREAEEKAKAAYIAVTHLITTVNNQGQMLNALSQMIYEMSQRQTAMEVVVDHVVSLQGLSAKDIIEEYVVEQER